MGNESDKQENKLKGVYCLGVSGKQDDKIFLYVDLDEGQEA